MTDLKFAIHMKEIISFQTELSLFKLSFSLFKLDFGSLDQLSMYLLKRPKKPRSVLNDITIFMFNSRVTVVSYQN